jgi:competence protein ComEA
MLIVCIGAFWLVRSPVPPTEASLPMATTPPTVESTAPVATTPNSNPALVHVAGAVVAPGVYELAPGSRIRDAIVAAGGPTPDADANAINLAATVADGSRVYVPIVGEVVPSVAPGDPTSPPDGPVDVNRATAEELDRLPGVGPSTAAAIVTERERNGPFVAVDDLDRVPGIGPAKLEALRDLVTT